MDSLTLLIACGVGVAAGIVSTGAGFYFGFRAGRRASITHDGIRQARELRDRILDGVITPVKLADGSVTHGVIGFGAVKRPD